MLFGFYGRSFQFSFIFSDVSLRRIQTMSAAGLVLVISSRKLRSIASFVAPHFPCTIPLVKSWRTRELR